MLSTASPEQLPAGATLDQARAWLRGQDQRIVAEQITLAKIPAPTFAETLRAEYLRRELTAAGLTEVAIDEAGNVVGWWQGERTDTPLVLAAHLDTVFPVGTALRLRRRGDRISVPGITDNARGLAALLAIARAVVLHRLRAPRAIVFAATTGEEGAGDLRGVRHLFRGGSPLHQAAGFVALDGAGIRHIVHQAVGARRLRVSIRGPGGHSWSDRGGPNPVHLVGRLVAELADYAGEALPGAGVAVTRIGGGTSVNALPEEAWIEIDARSEDAMQLERIETGIRGRVAQLTRRDAAALRVGLRRIGNRPCGATPAEHPLVQAAEAATRLVGGEPERVSASTDASLPMSLGVPAIAIGAGGSGGGMHTLDEWYSNTEGAAGIERAFLIVAAMAGLRG